MFVKEVQRAVLRGDADIAAHSAKDLPSSTAPRGCRSPRSARGEMPATCWSARRSTDSPTAHRLPQVRFAGAPSCEVGRPDLHFLELRGNIHTRLGKVPEGGAIVMAAAALQVLDLVSEITDYLPPASFVPSPGQGCVAVECRIDDDEIAALLSSIDHAPTRLAVEVERAFLAELGSGCSMPVGAHAADGSLTVFLAAEDGGRHITESIVLPSDHALAMARGAALARSVHDRLQ